jgi:peptidoglycan/xylan/chitin deacetylase (PgdA/CDA1 family)
MVALCFDDAWASLWTVVLPLLESYGLTAITYVSPGRIEDAVACRSAVSGADGESTAGSPVFATWPEIIALHESGRVDVQAHTFSHAMIFTSPEIVGFVTPRTTMPLLSWPRSGAGADSPFVCADMLGHPLFPQRSRVSDAHGCVVDAEVAERCCRYVTENGGARFFERAGWEQDLRDLVEPVQGRFETDAERDAAIEQELAQCRETLATRLGKSITQICMPWAICGTRAEALARKVGYESAVADALHGKRYVSRGTNPYRLMRLKHQYIPLLPGRGRRSLLSLGKGVPRG